jgi:hypothetical protein
MAKRCTIADVYPAYCFKGTIREFRDYIARINLILTPKKEG